MPKKGGGNANLATNGLKTNTMPVMNNGNNARLGNTNGTSVNANTNLNGRRGNGNNNGNANTNLNGRRGNGNGNNNNNVAKLNVNNNGNNAKAKPRDYTVIIIIVVAVILVAIVAFAGYKYITSKRKSGIRTKELIPYIHDAKTLARFSHGSIPASTERNSYNYNFWVYVNDYDYRSGEDKCILFKGTRGKSVHSNDTNENPGVYLLKDTNTMRVLINLETSYNPTTQATTEATTQATTEATNEVQEDMNNIISLEDENVANNAMPIEPEGFVGHHTNDNVKPGCDHCDIKHFPLQKWVSVNIAITNNVLDISLDGKLAKSCVLSGAPDVNNKDLLVCPEGGFNGFVSNLKASNKALPVKEIERLYKRGPNLKPGLLN